MPNYMAKILLMLLSFMVGCSAKTIYLDEWKPQFNYMSVETYPRDVADNYCRNRTDCGMRCEYTVPGKVELMQCHILTEINNCPEVRDGKMDSYIGNSITVRSIYKKCVDTTIYELKWLAEYAREPFEWPWPMYRTRDELPGLSSMSSSEVFVLVKREHRLHTIKDIKFKRNH